MKIIISPAKKMEVCEDLLEAGPKPRFLERTRRLLSILRSMDEGELQRLFKANDAITHENFLRYRDMDLDRCHTPALLSYVGIQYQYMAPKLFSAAQWEYVKENLRILSGFYGVLRPDDRVTPYRLEMQAKLAADGHKDLYGFWGDQLFESILEEERQGGNEPVILNLASKEYSKAVEKWAGGRARLVTCVFGARGKDGKILVKATEAKMGRGEMVKFLAEEQIADVSRVKEFCGLDYGFCQEESTEDQLVFLKK